MNSDINKNNQRERNVMSFSEENTSGMLLNSLSDVKGILRDVAQKSTHVTEVFSKI